MPSNRALRRASRRAEAAKAKPAGGDPAVDQDFTDQSPADQQPQSIQDDPKAMQLVDELKQMGYTADDVAAAMGDDDQDQSTGDGNAPATGSAAIQLPGMQ
ncbi:MAG: hypothetical protein ACLGXA_24465 [Acidobacteriota bacterium]